MSLGCSGGAQRSCRVHLYIILRWFYGKLILRKIGRFPLCACGNGVDLPHAAKRAFCDQMGPNVQNPMPFGSLPYQGLKNCGLSQKNIFLFFDFWGGPPGCFLRFQCCQPCFLAGTLLDGPGRTRKAKSSMRLRENPYFEKLADLWQIWPYSRYRGPDSHMQSGASPGSSVGDTNDWILFLWFILIVFCPWFRSATSHPVQNTQNHRFFDPKHHFLTHRRQKNKQNQFF